MAAHGGTADGERLGNAAAHDECDDSFVYKVKPDSPLLTRNKIGADRIAQL